MRFFMQFFLRLCQNKGGGRTDFCGNLTAEGRRKKEGRGPRQQIKHRKGAIFVGFYEILWRMRVHFYVFMDNYTLYANFCFFFPNFEYNKKRKKSVYFKTGGTIYAKEK